MKKFIICLSVSTLLYACASNDANTTDADNTVANAPEQNTNATTDSPNFTTVQWLDSVHQDLGKIKEGGVLEISWRFKNTGNKPLIISNANASCGCTVAEKPEAPITPGGEGIIKAKFDSKDRPGTQRKDVFVMANTSGNSQHQLSFAVEVQKQ